MLGAVDCDAVESDAMLGESLRPTSGLEADKGGTALVWRRGEETEMEDEEPSLPLFWRLTLRGLPGDLRLEIEFGSVEPVDRSPEAERTAEAARSLPSV